MANRTSLREIAKRAGVSVATVSMALRSCGTISRARSEQIRKLAASMGYHPNPLLSSLASKKFRTGKTILGTPIAILNFPVSTNGEVFPGATADLYLRDLVREARSLGYSPEVFDFPFVRGTRNLERVLHHRMMQGILLHGSLDQNGIMDHFDWSPYPVVQCARFHISPQFHTVRSNIFQSVKLAFEKVHTLGYQRIGLAVARHDIPLEDDLARHGAAVAVTSACLPEHRRLPVFLGSIEDRPAFKEWVKKNEPDVVIGFSPRFFWLLLEMGFSIPETMGFASLHLSDNPLEAACGLQQNLKAIARQSVVLLDQLIRERQRGVPELPLHMLIPSTWVEGMTLRPH